MYKPRGSYKHDCFACDCFAGDCLRLRLFCLRLFCSIDDQTFFTSSVRDALYIGSYALCDHPMCCRENFGEKRGTNSTRAGPLGDYNCDATITQQSVAFAASLTSDFVLFTGDLPAHDVWNLSQTSFFQVYDRFDSILPRALALNSMW